MKGRSPSRYPKAVLEDLESTKKKIIRIRKLPNGKREIISEAEV